MPPLRLLDDSGSRPLAFMAPSSHWMYGSDWNAGSFMSFRPGLSSHQQSPEEPSPPSLSLPMNVAPAQVCGMNRYFASDFNPFWAASVTIWVHCVPANIVIHTSGFSAASVVIGSVTVGADASIVSLT